MNMNPEREARGIAAYAAEQREVLDAIDRHGGVLHQDDFDAEFIGHKPHVWPMTGASFILGSLQQPGEWAKYLELTQLMVQAGLIRLEGRTPNVTYCAQPKE